MKDAVNQKIGLLSFNEMYAARGIGIFLVVVGHLVVPFGDAGRIYSFHMPLFFLLAGMLISKQKSVLRSLVRSFWNLVLYYMVTVGILSSVSILAIYLFDVPLNTSSPLDYKTYFIYPFTENSHNVDLFIVGWFLVSFIPAKFISHFFIKYFNFYFLISFIVVFSWLGMSFFSLAYNDSGDWIYLYASQIMTASSFMMTGYLLQNNIRFNLINNNFLFIVIFYFIFIILGSKSINMAWSEYPGQWYIRYIVAMLGILIVLVLSRKLSQQKIICLAGFYSRAIMSYHLFVFLCISLMFSTLGYVEVIDIHKFYAFNKSQFWILYAFSGFLVPLTVAIFINKLKATFFTRGGT